MLPPTAVSGTSGTSWAGASRKKKEKKILQKVFSSMLPIPVWSQVKTLGVICGSTLLQIIISYHSIISTCPLHHLAPAYLSGLLQEHIPSSSLQLSPAGLQSVPHLTLKLRCSQTPGTLQRGWNSAGEHAGAWKGEVCGRADVMIQMAFQ